MLFQGLAKAPVYYTVLTMVTKLFRDQCGSDISGSVYAIRLQVHHPVVLTHDRRYPCFTGAANLP